MSMHASCIIQRTVLDLQKMNELLAIRKIDLFSLVIQLPTISSRTLTIDITASSFDQTIEIIYPQITQVLRRGDMVPFFFLGALLAQAWSVSPQQLSPKNIFLLAGQSNMAGRGGVVINHTRVPTWDGAVPQQCQPNPSILRLSANLTWVLAHEPLHADIDFKNTNGVGPGMAFANAVLAKDPTFGVIGLVPCAIGGTKISKWGKGTFLYKQLVMRAASSLKYGGTIQALLWYQGESDTGSEEDAKSYKAKLQKLFLNLRHDLQSPTLPIIQVALASGSGTFIDTVREAQLGIGLLNLRTVDAKGLPLQPDALHLSTPAQVRLGEMLADTYLAFLPSGPISSPTPIGGVGSCCNAMLHFLVVPLSSMMVPLN